MNDELTGTLVLVHPELKDDPIFRQGQVGMITSDDTENNLVYVSFGSEGQVVYSTDELLALRTPSLVYFDMMRNATKLATADFKELFRISLLLDAGKVRDRRNAIELAKNNAVLLSYCMECLTERTGTSLSVTVHA